MTTGIRSASDSLLLRGLSTTGGDGAPELTGTTPAPGSNTNPTLGDLAWRNDGFSTPTDTCSSSSSENVAPLELPPKKHIHSTKSRANTKVAKKNHIPADVAALALDLVKTQNGGKSQRLATTPQGDVSFGGMSLHGRRPDEISELLRAFGVPRDGSARLALEASQTNGDEWLHKVALAANKDVNDLTLSKDINDQIVGAWSEGDLQQAYKAVRKEIGAQDFDKLPLALRGGTVAMKIEEPTVETREFAELFKKGIFEFTFKHEVGLGTDSTKLYVPSPKSGATLGPGFDLKTKTKERTEQVLVLAGYTQEQAAELAEKLDELGLLARQGAEGRSGTEAKNAIDDFNKWLINTWRPAQASKAPPASTLDLEGNLLIPTNSQEKIFAFVAVTYYQQAKNEITARFGPGLWEKLSPMQKGMLLDYAYNLGSLKGFPKFAKAVVSGDLDGVEGARKEYPQR